jgi:porin
VSGASPIRGRNLDTFGVGFFYLGVSDPLKQNARPASPLRNEQGVELYYNAAVTPWCRVTPDFQVVTPLQRRADPVLVLGLRAKLDFRCRDTQRCIGFRSPLPDLGERARNKLGEWRWLA